MPFPSNRVFGPRNKFTGPTEPHWQTELPQRVAGLVAWWKADRNVVTGPSGVESWTDLTANAWEATPVGLEGQPAVIVDGGGFTGIDFATGGRTLLAAGLAEYIADNLPNNDLSVFVVANPNTNMSEYRHLISLNDDSEVAQPGLKFTMQMNIALDPTIFTASLTRTGLVGGPIGFSNLGERPTINQRVLFLAHAYRQEVPVPTELMRHEVNTANFSGGSGVAAAAPYGNAGWLYAGLGGYHCDGFTTPHYYTWRGPIYEIAMYIGLADGDRTALGTYFMTKYTIPALPVP